MNKAEADHLILTKIDEIAWLLNLRAKDIPYYPVALAYMIVHREGGTLYINQARLDEESRACFEKNHIEMKDYEAIYDDVSGLQGFVWLDPNSANIRLALSLQTAYMQEESPIIEKESSGNCQYETSPFKGWCRSNKIHVLVKTYRCLKRIGIIGFR